jgi:hypothetical protein
MSIFTAYDKKYHSGRAALTQGEFCDDCDDLVNATGVVPIWRWLIVVPFSAPPYFRARIFPFALIVDSRQLHRAIKPGGGGDRVRVRH